VKKANGTPVRDVHGHVLFVYEGREERLKIVAEYFRDGLAKGELCIFVTLDPPRKVVSDFQSVGVDVKEAVERGKLRVFEMVQTYLPHGQFVANHMLSNVADFIHDAKAKGFTGLRTAGEMAWVYDHHESLTDATEYEYDVNGLSDDNPEFVGLCLYPLREGSGEVLDSALKTHPSFIYDGTLRTNPFTKTGLPNHERKVVGIKKILAKPS
jgi:hypothetical protein